MVSVPFDESLRDRGERREIDLLRHLEKRVFTRTARI